MSGNSKLRFLLAPIFLALLFLVSSPVVSWASKATRVWVGIMIQRITPELQEVFKLKDPKGALVSDIVPNGPADLGGMKRGDVIRRFDGVEILSLETLPKQVASTTPGKSVNVEVIREGQVKTLVIRIDPISQVLPGEEPEVKREYWDNGKLKSEVPHNGLATFWYESGEKEREVPIKNGKSEGLSTTWTRSGKKRWENQYKNGQLDGLSIDFLKNKHSTHYKNGEKDGLETWWFIPDKQKSVENHYKNGQIDGRQTAWRKTGKKQYVFNYKNGKYEGPQTFWYESGVKQSVTHYKNDKAELDTGWFESGKKKYETHYKNGKKEGQRKEWYKSGRKKSLKHFKNGIENGIRKEWDENGTLTYEGKFVDGSEEIK
jgi:antitoxin component YwqK of YwqJK toxin-antitoxin module